MVDDQQSIMTPVISVVIPVYNVEKYLDRCLQSVVDNDYKQLQIICVNDGSTDGCAAILDKWAQNDSRIEIITTENNGLSEARNNGIRAATGDYIAFIDSDDWIHLRYFSTLLSGLIDNNADISMCGFLKVHDGYTAPEAELTESNWKNFGWREYQTLGNQRLFVWGRIYKRELIEPTFDRSMVRGEDLPYNTMILYHHPQVRIAYIDRNMYYYYYRQESLAHTTTGIEGKQRFDFFYPKAASSVASHDNIGQGLFVVESAKSALSYRYRNRYKPENRKTAKTMCAKIRKTLLSADRCVSLKDKIVYTALLLCPPLYRAFQIMKDPTMLAWEKAQRERSRG